MPIYAFFSAASYHGLSYNPTFLHGRGIDNVEALIQTKTVSAVTLKKNSILAVKLHSFLEIYVERDGLTVM